MRRCGSGFLPILALAFVVAFTGCLGKSSGNSTTVVATVTLSPAGNSSIEIGKTQAFTATARNATGGTVASASIQYIVQNDNLEGSEPLSITAGGNACAGTWDPTGSICTPGTPGIAIVTAVSNGVSSAQAYVYVHEHVASLQISNAQAQAPLYDCFSQGQTWFYQATAYGSGNPPVDITDSVGPVNWSSSNSGVVTTTNYVPPNQSTVLNQVQVTAKSPGFTQLVANVSGTSSNPIPFTTCLIQAIYLQIGGQATAGNTITVNNGASIPITATVIDSLYKYTHVPLAAPPLTWSTTNPEVAAFGTTSNSVPNNNATARTNLGGATLTASCTPPTCNIGLPGVTPSGQTVPSLPIYASTGTLPNGTTGYGSISVDVVLAPSATLATYSAWAATTGCGNTPGCTSALFSVTPTTTGSNPIGAILSLPRTPNSLVFNHVSSPRVYIGSDQGLMYVDTTATSPSPTLISNSQTPCNVSLCGQVLAISNDGKVVVVGDNVSTPSQVYIYNASSTTASSVDLVLPGETTTAAAFSPDQLKVFILTASGNLYIYSTVDALSSVSTFGPGTDIEFSADGSFAYVAGVPANAGGPTNSVSAFSTCSLPGAATTNIGSVVTSATPTRIFPSPVVPLPVLTGGSLWTTQNIFALEPSTGNIEFLTTQFMQNPIGYADPPQFTCNPPTILPGSFQIGQSFNLGQGQNLTPVYAQLVNDGTQILIVARKIPAVLLFDVDSGTTSSIALSSSTVDPLSASASSDGSQVFIAACDQYDQDGTTCATGSIHVVGTVEGQKDYGDTPVPYHNVNNNNDTNMCNDGGNPAPQCLPNLVAIKPM
ncbi:MAG: hypothetical protein ABSD75_18885 [Terriglobales bacterium]|jgi:hypothetical protein